LARERRHRGAVDGQAKGAIRGVRGRLLEKQGGGVFAEGLGLAAALMETEVDGSIGAKRHGHR